MYAFFLIVTITLQVANAPPQHSFGVRSDDQYNPEECEKRAQAAMDRMGANLSNSIPGAKVEIEHRCMRLETRKI
jgi:hypothetical protein